MDSSVIRSKIKDNLLLVAMSAGVIGYFILDAFVKEPSARSSIVSTVTGILPYLLFTMLFLEFSKIEPRDLFPKRWIVMCFSYQLAMAAAMILILRFVDCPVWLIPMLMGTLVCVLSPTATAVAVMSSKLGGKAASATTYAVLSSLFTAVMVPLLFPIVSPDGESISFMVLFLKIFRKVCSVVIIPLLISLALRSWAPKAHTAIEHFAKDKSFYLWSVCIMINTAQITRLLFLGLVNVWTTMLYLAFALVLCIVNFILGKKFGDTCDDRISAGQSLGQKNTILAIWIAMSFLIPESAIILGAYMIWQNIINSLQLSNPKFR